jgi:hypothetical protein
MASERYQQVADIKRVSGPQRFNIAVAPPSHALPAPFSRLSHGSRAVTKGAYIPPFFHQWSSLAKILEKKAPL